MTGSIDKYIVKGSSKPRWRYRIYTGKNEAGVKQYVSAGGFEKQGDAQDAMRNRLSALVTKDNAPPVQNDPTLGEWLATWLDTYAPDKCQPKTLERYRELAAYVLKSPPAAVRLKNLSHRHIEPALFALLRAKAIRHAHLSPNTIRHIAGLLSVALNKAFRLELIAVNPMLRVELPSGEHKDARALTPDEIQALRLACRGDWTFPLIEIALASGARRGELLALEWPDLDWMSKTLTINKSLEQTAAGLRIKRPKNGRPRKFQLPQTAVMALQFHRSQQQEHQRLFAGDYVDRGLIFAEPNGDFLQPALVSQVIVRRMKKAGIENASLHSLRHSHASNLLSKGVPLAAVSARLGHADVNITARVYSHAMPADDQRAADAWDSLLASPKPTSNESWSNRGMSSDLIADAVLSQKPLMEKELRGSANGNRTR